MVTFDAYELILDEANIPFVMGKTLVCKHLLRREKIFQGDQILVSHCTELG